jgi:outer membrane protein assembly factor BamB
MSEMIVRRSSMPGMHKTGLLMLFLLAAVSEGVRAEDWPTYRHDLRRSGVTAEQIVAKDLRPVWRWQSALPPASAWPDSARWDAYAVLDGLRSMRNYDPVFHPIVVGQQVFLPSNSEDTLRCLDLQTGNEVWRFTTESPIRIAPAYHEQTLYFGSDEGAVYAVASHDGSLRWRRMVVPDAGAFINDGRLCSFAAVRTGVLIDVEQEVAIVAAGVFPWRSTHLAAFRLHSGEPVWQSDLGTGWTLEGTMLLSPQHVIAPQGRAAPQLFERRTGKPVGPLSGGGGSFVLLTEDDQILHGPGNKAGWITQSKVTSREKVASFERGTAMIVAGTRSYLLDEEKLAALDRTTGEPQWIVECGCPHDLVLSDKTLWVGGNDEVRAYSAETGTLEWMSSVTGRAMGIVVANGFLLVSTDEGVVHAFAEPTTLAKEAAKLPANSGPATTATVTKPAEPNSATLPARPKRQMASSSFFNLFSFLDPLQKFVGLPPTPALLPVQDPDLVDHWVFQANQIEVTSGTKRQLVVKSLSGAHGQPAPLPKQARLAAAGREHALVLDGRTECPIAADFNTVAHPREAITAMVWVRIDVPLPWGGLVSISQDNGSFEKGWILGYRNDRFGFALNGQKGPDRLTWVMADSSRFTPGGWHLVAGTYDGLTMQLYVDGRPVASSTEQSGPILYPPRAAYHVGAYLDDDEHFVATGMLHEVRVYQRALSAEEIAASYAEKSQNFPPPLSPSELAGRTKYAGTIPSQVARGPYLEFAQPQTATIRWWTATPQLTHIELQPHPYSQAAIEIVTSNQAVTEHVATISPVRPHETVKYRIGQVIDGETSFTGFFECDGHFDFQRPRLRASQLSETALQQAAAWYRLTGHDEPRGFGLILGASDEARFAEAVARMSHVDLLVIDADPDRVAAARRRLLDAGVYGRPVSVRLLTDLPTLALPNRTADFLIITPGCDPQLAIGDVSWESLLLKLQPKARALLPRPLQTQLGSAANWMAELTADQRLILEPLLDSEPLLDAPSDVWKRDVADWLIFTAPERTGAAEWTHMYGTPGNAAYVGETLAGVNKQEDLTVVWAGRPGPRYQSDRGNRKAAPLAAHGRLFMQGLHRVIAVDACNGAILWSLELPEVVRFNVPRDCSNWCADEKHVYLATKGRCLVLDARNGKIVTEFDVYNPDQKQLDWGYLAREKNLLIGSSVAANSAFTEFWGAENWYDAKEGEHAKKVCSEMLFATYHDTGGLVWKFEDGLIVNPTITIDEGRVYFLVARNEKLQAGQERRLEGEEFWNSMHFVALDTSTGKTLWDVPARPLPGKSAVYVASGEGKLVLATSNAGSFGLYVFDAAKGEMLWRGKYDWEVDHHGKHLSRPAIVEGRIYLRPLTLDLATGAVLSQKFPLGHQCGTYTASQNALFLRAGELAVWNRETGESTRWNRVRPDCWISTIPALGMLLSPEGGGGCSCGGWIETSMGFAPRVEQQQVKFTSLPASQPEPQLPPSDSRPNPNP